MSENVLTTAEGREITLRPVSLDMIQEIRVGVRRRLLADGLMLDPPVYETKTVAGEIERHPHDESTLSTDADKAAWAAHQAALQQLEAETNQQVVRYLLAEGVVCNDAPQAWLDKMAWIGVDVAENAMDRRLQYIQRELLRTPGDLMRATQRILHLSTEGSKQLQDRLGVLDELFQRVLEGEAVGDL